MGWWWFGLAAEFKAVSALALAVDGTTENPNESSGRIPRAVCGKEKKTEIERRGEGRVGIGGLT
jgi:hypothetical protein